MKVSTYTKYSLLSAILLAFFMMDIQKAQAQYFAFGKNRVQYEQFDWRYIQSEHFDIYYYSAENYDLANFTAFSLETALRQLHEDFEHQIADRIQVIVYDSHNDFSQTNVVHLPVEAQSIGGVTDLFKNRITVPFNNNYADFRSLLHHELVHAVLNDMYYGGSVQSIISGGNQLQLPDWFNEGLSEYAASGWDTNTDMWMRDMVINDYLPPVPRLYGYLAYRGGQSIWNYIVEEYGREKIGEIMQTLKSHRNINSTFQRTMGLSLEEFSERWRDYYRKRYLPEVAEREDISTFATQLTGQKRNSYDTSPTISPQGDKLAMITNQRGYFDVVVISAITGERLKTLVKGEENINFEELNILNPNLNWSPDGSKLALSAKSKGKDNLAIIDYNTGEVRMIRLSRMDAIESVAWSPDGTKIAFDGNIGPFQDIFVYNLETGDFSNVTNDVIADYQPAWSDDSETIYFASNRGDNLELNTVKNTTHQLLFDYMYSSDIYSVRLGSNQLQRLTLTPNWDEYQPSTTNDGQLLYISDENGIPNVYRFNLEDRIAVPLTNLQTGVMQLSTSADGSRIAVNTVNEGTPDIFMIRSPFMREVPSTLSKNQWAQRREEETFAQRVPAIGYVQQLLRTTSIDETTLTENAAAVVDPTQQTVADTAVQDTADEEENTIDFRNYVFDSSIEEDTAFAEAYLDESKFQITDNKTEDGRYVPQEYRLRFSTDIAYAGGSLSTLYGTYGLTQILFSDLLGNHQIAFGSNLNFDLRNSSYFLQYTYLENRFNWSFSFFHNASTFQTFSGQLLRYRNLGGAVNMQYPIDKFRRIDASFSIFNLSQDFTHAFANISQNESSTFTYPQIIYTRDNTLQGFITPLAGSRYSVSMAGSPPITNETLQFISVLGDYRKYFNLGSGYSFALRGSGAASFGRDSQTFFMGGMLGWINQRWSGRSIPIDRLGETFFTLPAVPLRGHEYNALFGDKFTLANAEFRFPLFAAILPGPIPVLPLYNLTGVAFLDAGMAWGENVVHTPDGTSREVINPASLDFELQEQRDIYVDRGTGDVLETEPGDFQTNPNRYLVLPANRGDVLMGAGFGLRTIVFGLPLRYDIGWPLYKGGFDTKPVHYFSIGVDF